MPPTNKGPLPILVVPGRDVAADGIQARVDPRHGGGGPHVHEQILVARIGLREAIRGGLRRQVSAMKAASHMGIEEVAHRGIRAAVLASGRIPAQARGDAQQGQAEHGDPCAEGERHDPGHRLLPATEQAPPDDQMTHTARQEPAPAWIPDDQGGGGLIEPIHQERETEEPGDGAPRFRRIVGDGDPQEHERQAVKAQERRHAAAGEDRKGDPGKAHGNQDPAQGLQGDERDRLVRLERDGGAQGDEREAEDGEGPPVAVKGPRPEQQQGDVHARPSRRISLGAAAFASVSPSSSRARLRSPSSRASAAFCIGEDRR
jgi:hypothetical protein